MRPREDLGVIGRTADFAEPVGVSHREKSGLHQQVLFVLLARLVEAIEHLLADNTQIRKALAEHTAVIGFPKQIPLTAIGDFGDFRREIFEAPDVFFRDAIISSKTLGSLSGGIWIRTLLVKTTSKSILERNVVSRGLDNIDAGHGCFRFLDAIALHLDAAERCEPGALQRAQHQADIAADLEKARVFRNGLEPFLNELIAPFAITAQAGLVDLLLAQRVRSV